METVVLEHTIHPETHHTLDAVDVRAAATAQKLLEAQEHDIEHNKAAKLVEIYNNLDAQYAARRVASVIHIGDIISESVSFATRTPDLESLDEIFTCETIYDPILKRPMSRYEVKMLQGDGSTISVILHSDGTMQFMRIQDGETSTVPHDQTTEIMKDLMRRAFVASETYKMHKEEAIKDHLDPTLYSSVADMDARAKLVALRGEERPTTLE